MQSLKKRIIILLIINIFILACRTSAEKNKSGSVADKNLALNKLDSQMIRNYLSQVVTTDTAFSETRCAQRINYYDSLRKLVFRKSLQHCMSDMTMKWKWETYFNSEGDIYLAIAFDGAGNILEIKRD